MDVAVEGEESFDGASDNEENGGGLPPLVTVIGAGLTVALGVATIISGVSTNGKGSDYDAAIGDWQDQDCQTMSVQSTACQGLYDKAQTRLDAAHSAETRTNVLLASTLVAGAATAIIGLFFTDWPEDEGANVLFGVAPNGDAYGQMKVAF